MSNVGATVVGGRYEIISKIAEGGMGAVFRAQHSLSRKIVALKVIPNAGGEDESTRQRFLREVAAPAQIGHRGIVEVYDAGFDLGTGALFVAMELLEGETLRDLLEKGPLPADRIYSIFLRLLEPLAAAHAVGFVHRDLKPENVFVQRTKEGAELVKLLDFGIARHLRGELNVTQTGVAMGTPHYMSPEQASSARDVSQSSDVWAVGVMLYEALTGSPPFRGDTLAGLVVDVLTRPHRPVDDVLSSVPHELARLLDRVLDKVPEKRPADGGALLAELRIVLERPEGLSAVHPPGQWIATAPMAFSPSPVPGHDARLTPPVGPLLTPKTESSFPVSGADTVRAQGLVAMQRTGGAGSTPTPSRSSVPATLDSDSPLVPPTAQLPDRGSSADRPSRAPSRTGLYVLLGVLLGGSALVGGVLLLAAGAWYYANHGTQAVHGELAFGDGILPSGQLYDSYDFQWLSGQRVTIDATASAFNPRVLVRTPSGRSIDDDPSAPGAHLELLLEETGTYHVLVTSTRWAEQGAYDLTARTR